MPRRLHPALVAALVAVLSLTLVGSAAGAKRVAAPKFVRNIDTGETGWFSSPGLVDLNRDGRLEIVAPFYSTFVFDAKGRRLGQGTATSGRVYAPGVVADIDGDRRTGDRGGRQRGDGGGLQPERRRGCGSSRAGRPHVQRRAVPRDARHGRGRPRPRRPRGGGGNDDQHLDERIAGVRVRRVGRARCRAGPATTRARRHASTAPATRATARTARTSGSATSTTTAAGGRRDVRQPPDQRVQPRRHVGARVGVATRTATATPRAIGSAGASSSAG